MSDSTRLKYLRIALVLVGIIFIFGIYLLMMVWLRWTWHTGHADYPLMIVDCAWGLKGPGCLA